MSGSLGGQQQELEVLFWIVVVSLAGVVAGIAVLVASGRTVPPPMMRLRRRRAARSRDASAR
jgi:hypothetical protein